MGRAIVTQAELALTKGIPAGSDLQSAEIGRQGWNILQGDLPLPVCVLKASALEHNSRWMQRFVRERNALIAPHVKTTMCPPIIRRQLADGAWAVTVATLQQMWVCGQMGVSRIILPTQPVAPAELTAITGELARDPGFDFYCLAD